MSDESRRNSDSKGLYSSKSSMSSDSTGTSRNSFEQPTSSPEDTVAMRPHRSSDSSFRDVRLKRNPSFREYSLVRQIGSKDIGRVYLCRRHGEADEGRFYAMKVVDNDVLDHPFLPSLFAEFEASNFSCVVMEFCAGGDEGYGI